MLKRLTVAVCERLRCEFLELFEQIVAIIAVDLDGKGFRRIETEETQNGLCVYDIITALDDDFIIVALGDVDELLDAA